MGVWLVSDLNKLDALLCKMHSKVLLVLMVPRLDMCRSISLRWLLGLRKLRSSKKVEILQVVIALRVGYQKTFFLSWRKETFFFVIFTMKFSSSALSYLYVHSTFNFAIRFLYFWILTQIKHQKSNTWIL